MFSEFEKVAIAKTVADAKFRGTDTYPRQPEIFTEGFVAGMEFLERVAEEEKRGTAEAEVVARRVKLLGDAKKEEPAETPIISKSHPGTTMMLASPDELTLENIPEADELTLENIPEDQDGNVTGCVTFKMKKRWLPAFYGMLSLMEKYGKAGCSRTIGMYSDGDGDFRPTFSVYANNKPVKLDAPDPKYPTSTQNILIYDAG